MSSLSAPTLLVSSNGCSIVSGSIPITRLLTSRPLLWLLLAVPALWLVWRWASGGSTYGEVVSRSGLWGALLLIPTTAVTPLRLLFAQGRWLGWLIERAARCGGGVGFQGARGHEGRQGWHTDRHGSVPSRRRFFDPIRPRKGRGLERYFLWTRVFHRGVAPRKRHLPYTNGLGL